MSLVKSCYFQLKSALLVRKSTIISTATHSNCISFYSVLLYTEFSGWCLGNFKQYCFWNGVQEGNNLSYLLYHQRMGKRQVLHKLKNLNLMNRYTLICIMHTVNV